MLEMWCNSLVKTMLEFLMRMFLGAEKKCVCHLANGLVSIFLTHEYTGALCLSINSLNLTPVVRLPYISTKQICPTNLEKNLKCMKKLLTRNTVRYWQMTRDKIEQKLAARVEMC